MIPLKINKKPVSLPTCWADVTWDQIQTLPDNSGELSINWVSHFTGYPVSFWEEYQDVQEFLQIGTIVSFPRFEPDLTECNHILTWDGNDIKLPQDWGNTAVGPYRDALKFVQDLYNKNEQTPITKEDTATAFEGVVKIALEFALHGAKDYDHARALKRSLGECKYLQVARYGTFFLTIHTVLNSGIQKT